MIINTTKKIILLFSIISLNSSMFGMLDFSKIQKDISTRVLSQKRQVATAILVPLAVAGAFVLTRHKDEISSLLEKIPMPSEKVIFGVATAAAMPAAYAFLGTFSPEEQFKLSHSNYTEIKKHQIIQNKKILQEFIADKQEVQQKKEKSMTLLDFINNNFGDKVNNSLYPSIKVVNELCDLEVLMSVECERLEQISDAGTSWVAVELIGENKKTVSSIGVSGFLSELRENILFIQQFRGKIMDLPEYKIDKKNSIAIEKNKLLKQKLNGNSLSSFVPIFIQPFMLLFQIFLTRIGLLQ